MHVASDAVSGYRRPAHSFYCVPGILATFSAAATVLDAALTPLEADCNRIFDAEIPWGSIKLVTCATSLIGCIVVAFALQADLLSLGKERRRLAKIWTTLGLCCGTPIVLFFAFFFVVLVSGGMDHFRD